ncbi:MAG: sodium:alanine symporter family protein [Gammaproteobacteria bacterium]|jgi:alanine or glycine:cation symporter, AGCS family|nr:sodium:alanine symporter family protein [Gammaproteobacteria bacterium]
METLINLFETLGSYAWGPYMLALIAFTGLYLIIGLKFLPIIKIPYAFKLLKTKSDDKEKGEISPRSALATAMSATVGTGNIAGVATAIAIGGPGAIFWMWVMGFVGMATKYGEAVLAVKFREVDENGSYVGGPMYYIKNGLGEKWKWLGFLFALFGTIAAFGIGNMVQSNTVANQLQNTLGVDPLIAGIVIASAAGLVIIGGVKRIGTFATALVPTMALIYLISAITIVLMNIHLVPQAFSTIFDHAFNGTAATGGFAGATVLMAIRFGIARGVFSNEAGLGSAPIAHAAAKTNSPVKQGTIAMLGTFFDTIIICSLTALVIIISGQWVSGDNGAVLTSNAFVFGLPVIGETIVTICLILFAFTTILGWSYYGERCSAYIFGAKAIMPYRVLWLLSIVLGAYALKLGGSTADSVNLIWLIADVMNGFMAIPNLIALILLSPVIFKLSKEYFLRK